MDIAIVLFDRFTALDAVGPYQVLTHLPEARVTFVAAEAGPVTSDDGRLRLVAERALAELPEPDVLLVPGGIGSRAAARDESLLAWVREVHARTRWTTSVCTGALVLGAAGLLEGRRATTYWSIHERLAEYGATPVRERVVEDGRVMTAAGVSAGIDMALRLAARLAGEDVARAVQLGIEYDPAPPFDSGSPEKAPAATVELVRGLMAREEEVASPAN